MSSLEVTIRAAMSMGTKNIFDALVANALDFLDQSVKDLETSPKYSLIHFCTAIELMLKARLMSEHWSLVLADPRRADRNKFPGSGDFKSVGLEESMERLERVVGEKLDAEKEAFEVVRKHRNKLVHFYNEDYETAKPGAVEQVVKEQCRAWMHLHRLLTDRWGEQFKEHKTALERANQMMIQQRVFLKTRYETLRPDIDRGIKKGEVYRECRSCGYLSAKTKNLPWEIFKVERCVVCEAKHYSLDITCPSCKEEVSIEEYNESCPSCDDPLTAAEIADVIDPQGDHGYCKATDPCINIATLGATGQLC